MPTSLDAIRESLDRERRDKERRDDGLDRRIFPRERRGGERRLPRGSRPDTDPHMVLPDVGDIVVELADDDLEPIDQTQVVLKT